MISKFFRPRFIITSFAVLGMIGLGVIEPDVRVPVVSALGGAIAGYFGVETQDKKEDFTQ